MNIIQEGIARGIIEINDDQTKIRYITENKTRIYTNPEEKIQAHAFCSLVIDYNYPVERIKLMVPVQMGVDITKEADIVVYDDDSCKKPFIVVECKKENISEQEFNQASNQAFLYAYALAGTVKHVWVTSGIKNEYFKVDKESEIKEGASDIPQYGKEVLRYKYAKNGGTTKDGQKLSPLEKITESDLTAKFRQAHQALWAGGELNPSEAFDELDKLIFCKIVDEKKRKKTGEPYDFQIITVEPDKNEPNIGKAKKDAIKKTDENLLMRLKKLYHDEIFSAKKKADPEMFQDDIKLSAKKVRTVVGYLEGVNFSETDLDSKGKAFETFMGSFFRGEFGQYFTPRTIVSFIVDSLPLTEEHKVLDTSCGSGGFLLHALDKVRKKACADHECGLGFEKDETPACHRQWHDFAEKSLFGIEINEQIARTAKMNMIIHDDGHTNVVSSDALISPKSLCEKKQNIGFKENSFDYILTNPPFGATIKATEKKYIEEYTLGKKEKDWLNENSKESDRPSQSTEVLFIEQAERYLTEDGYLAIVLPDGILTNSSMQYVRNYISETFRIVAVISMPQTAFAANGAGVKSSVLFLKKYEVKEKKRRVDIKKDIQAYLISKSDMGKELRKLVKDKKSQIAEITKEIKMAEKAEEVNKIERLRIKKQELSDEFDEKIENIKELLTEKFNEDYKIKVGEYPIFMAIAEDIGFDATGKETGKNELPKISEELSKFIIAIEEGKDKGFV